MNGLLKRAFFILFAISLGFIALSCNPPTDDPEKPPTPPPLTPAPGGPIVMSSEGATLSMKDIQYSIYSAIDWNAVSPDSQINGFLGGGTQNLRDLKFDPETSKADLERLFDRAKPITLLYPQGDDRLAKAAESIMKNLQDVGLQVSLTPVPAAELQAIMKDRLAAGEEVLAINR